MNLVMSFRNLPVEGVEDLLARFDQEDIGGPEYFDHEPITCPDVVCLEDLAVTLLVNSRADLRAARSIVQHVHEIDLSQLPNISLQDTSPQQRDQVAAFLAAMSAWEGFAAARATKLLHKKRPKLVPILDNRAIFGAYMNDHWPQEQAPGEGVEDHESILQAIESIWKDLTRPNNQATWEALTQLRPRRTRIQLFDNVWWTFFKDQGH